MKKTSLIALVALTASVMADDGAAAMNNSGSTRPALVNSNSMRAFADALIWRTEQDGTQWATLSNSTTKATSLEAANFGWDWGFRIGFGMDLEQDEWDAVAAYTWFQANKNSSADNSHGLLTDVFSGTNHGTLTSATNKWKIEVSIADLAMGGNYMVKNHLMLRPHLGVKAAWINQHSKSAFETATATTFQNDTAKSKFFGIGPSGGVCSTWKFGDTGFHLMGELGGAIMWGDFDVHQTATQSSAGTTTTDFDYKKNGLNRVAPMLDTAIGLGWGTNFNNDSSRFSVNVAYELQYWFKQNRFLGSSATTTITGQDLAFQGGTLDFRLDF